MHRRLAADAWATALRCSVAGRAAVTRLCSLLVEPEPFLWAASMVRGASGAATRRVARCCTCCPAKKPLLLSLLPIKLDASMVPLLLSLQAGWAARSVNGCRLGGRQRGGGPQAGRATGSCRRALGATNQHITCGTTESPSGGSTNLRAVNGGLLLPGGGMRGAQGVQGPSRMLARALRPCFWWARGLPGGPPTWVAAHAWPPASQA